MEPNTVTFNLELTVTVSIPFATLPSARPDYGPHITCEKYGTCRSYCNSQCAPKTLAEAVERQHAYIHRENNKHKAPWRVGLLEAMEDG